MIDQVLRKLELAKKNLDGIAHLLDNCVRLLDDTVAPNEIGGTSILRVVAVAPGEYSGRQTGYKVTFGLSECGIMCEFTSSEGVRGIAERVTVESDGKTVWVK